MPDHAAETPRLDPNLHSEEYYRDLQRKNTLRLALMYLAPLILLSTYFYFQYRAMLRESTSNHLRTVAENYAKTMDLFLEERLVNLSNAIDDPRLTIPPQPTIMREMLQKLNRASDTFVDIDFFDQTGSQLAYEGPYGVLGRREYGSETWFVALKEAGQNYIVTDIYPGFRGIPHFTIAIRRTIENRCVVLRATLDPKKLELYLSSLVDPRETQLSVVNSRGTVQLATIGTGNLQEDMEITPDPGRRLDTRTLRVGGKTVPIAYAWLRTCGWALVARPSAAAATGSSGNAQINTIAFSVTIIALIFSVIVIRARKIVKTIRQTDATRAQLSDNLLHASKLAAVGELASGIAHEINNPLAIINEEVGLIKDLTDPQFKLDVRLEDLSPHLDNIQDAVFRCRDITSKLLAFVRKTEVSPQRYALHDVIEKVVHDYYQRELAVSNIEIVRNYCRENPAIVADKTQLEQVFLNLINNAVDAIASYGRITITTALVPDSFVRIDVEDTGTGMTQDQLEKIFMPFYTTKQADRGTGLGLSISYAIIRGMGGEISVSSTWGKGSIFSISLPLASAPPPSPDGKNQAAAVR
jgi:two-component system NtrC family sensor kinase